MEYWKNGGMEEWRNGIMEYWRNEIFELSNCFRNKLK